MAVGAPAVGLAAKRDPRTSDRPRARSASRGNGLAPNEPVPAGRRKGSATAARTAGTRAEIAVYNRLREIPAVSTVRHEEVVLRDGTGSRVKSDIWLEARVGRRRVSAFVEVRSQSRTGSAITKVTDKIQHLMYVRLEHELPVLLVTSMQNQSPRHIERIRRSAAECGVSLIAYEDLSGRRLTRALREQERLIAAARVARRKLAARDRGARRGLSGQVCPVGACVICDTLRHLERHRQAGAD